MVIANSGENPKNTLCRCVGPPLPGALGSDAPDRFIPEKYGFMDFPPSQLHRAVPTEEALCDLKVGCLKSLDFDRSGNRDVACGVLRQDVASRLAVRNQGFLGKP